MGIFGKDKSSDLPPLISDEELDAELASQVNYNSVLDWLGGLSDEEYKQVCDVAQVYREANERACNILGMKNEPTTQIQDPKDEHQTVPPVILEKEPNWLDDDDFLADEPKAKKVKVTVKKGDKAK